MPLHIHPHPNGPGDFLPLVVLAGILALYLVAVARRTAAQRYWNPWRTASFIAGIGLLAIAVSPALMQSAHASLQAHMLQHLLIGMLAPLALVLAAPLTLVMRSLPTTGAQRMNRIFQSEFMYWLGHPLTALMLNIGGMYVLYLTPVFSLSQTNTPLHIFIHLHFFLAGYLYCWSIAGVDAAPRRSSMAFRVTVLLIGLAAHGLLSKLMYIYLFPTGVNFTAEEIQSAAKLMYYGGDLAEILLAVALFYAWYKKRIRIHRAVGQRAQFPAA